MLPKKRKAIPKQIEKYSPPLRKVIMELDWDTARIYFLTLDNFGIAHSSSGEINTS
jgi:hypothetical protein